MYDTSKEDRKGHSKLMHYGMMACCAVMLVPVAGFFIAGGTLAGFWQSAGAFAPLLLCVGAHLVMHKMMGKSCHSDADEQETPAQARPVQAKVPLRLSE